MHKTLLALVATLALSMPLAADDCEHRRDDEIPIDAVGVSSLRLRAGAGGLEMTGQTGGTQVVVQATACASSADLLDRIHLDTGRQGDQIRVEAEIPEGDGQRYARLDLSIELPSTIGVQVEDSSGALRIRAVQAVTLRDGSGEIEIADIAADVTVEDGSGEMLLERIGGDVDIHDGSGEIEVREVGGRLTVVDGSGELRITRVDRDVEIREDGSGGIRIAEVGGNVMVDRDGSGSIWVRQVTGDLTVERDGSGSIDHQDVEGRVRLP